MEDETEEYEGMSSADRVNKIIRTAGRGRGVPDYGTGKRHATRADLQKSLTAKKSATPKTRGW